MSLSLTTQLLQHKNNFCREQSQHFQTAWSPHSVYSNLAHMRHCAALWKYCYLHTTVAVQRVRSPLPTSFSARSTFSLLLFHKSWISLLPYSIEHDQLASLSQGQLIRTNRNCKADNGVNMLGSKTEPGFNVESKLRKLVRQQDLRGIHLPALPGSG